MTLWRRHHGLIGAALIVLVTSVAYLPSLTGGFLLDDDLLLTDNLLVKAGDGLYRIWFTAEPVDYWPVTNTSFWLEWRLWGTNAAGYRVTNLALHVAVAGLVWAILHQLSIPGGFLAALLFAVHPVNVESVAWISQRKGLLAMLFFLLSILSYLKSESVTGPRSSMAGRWYWMSLVAFGLAMLSKIPVAILPLLLVWLTWWRRPLEKRDLVRIAPFGLLAAILVGVNLSFRNTADAAESAIQLGFADRLLGAAGVVWFYLFKVLWPFDLIFVYPEWDIQAGELRWWIPLLAAMAITLVLWRYRADWGRPFLFAWGYFCTALVPVMGFIDIGAVQPLLVADHYQYVALIGVAALLAAGLVSSRKWLPAWAGWAPNALAIVTVAVLSVLTWQRSGLFADSTGLYRATLESNPDSWMVHSLLGSASFQAGGAKQAIQHYEEALRLKPDYPEAHNNLGNALLSTGRLPEAIDHFEEALRLRPNYPRCHNNMGNALRDSGRLSEAIQHFEEALRLKPDFADAHNNLGIALSQGGRFNEAIDHLEQALRLKPDFAPAHNNLGIALLQAGRLKEAIDHFNHALRLKPDFPDARYNLEVVTMMKSPVNADR